jgi:hypothetical protein
VSAALWFGLGVVVTIGLECAGIAFLAWAIFDPWD